MTVGNRLRALRTEMGISQKAAAGKLKISASMLSNYEHDINQPSLDCLIRIAAFYHTSIDYLAGLTYSPVSTETMGLLLNENVPLGKFAKVYEGADTENRAHLDYFIDKLLIEGQ